MFAALLDKNPRRFWTRREQAVDGHDYDHLVIVDLANVGCPGNDPTIVSCKRFVPPTLIRGKKGGGTFRVLQLPGA